MLNLILSVFRYAFLAILYIFIFQLIKVMFQDLWVESRKKQLKGSLPPPERLDGPPSFLEVKPLPGADAGLIVLISDDPGLPPGKMFAVYPDGEAVLGRNSRNRIVISDPFASMEHAAVYMSGGQCWLEDRDSKNGTFLNEVRIKKPTVLVDGDKIRIGGVTLQLVRWAYEVESVDRNRPDQGNKRG